MVAIIDYGMGNLHSAKKAFERMGATVEITQDADVIRRAGHVVLPGVGAFPDAMQELRLRNLDALVRERVALGVPFLGICLGMQLMYESSEEGGLYGGLSIVNGTVGRIDAKGLKVPHMGWNEVHAVRDCPLLHGIDGSDFYFVHSYCATDPESAGGLTEYGSTFVSVAWDGKNAFGTQFHPEKSGDAGMALIGNFLARKGA
ncbi:MAG: imidazole glycerol phosphate synthase subunit HisH [Bacillota bacterium]